MTVSNVYPLAKRQSTAAEDAEDLRAFLSRVRAMSSASYKPTIPGSPPVREPTGRTESYPPREGNQARYFGRGR